MFTNTVVHNIAINPNKLNQNLRAYMFVFVCACKTVMKLLRNEIAD